MRTNADAFFAIGKTHMVCQDYAVARALGADDNAAYAIVCDGCSSSPRTDVGARLVAHAASSHMKWLRTIDPTFSDRERLIIDAAARAAKEISLEPHSLDSTLIAARTGRNESGEKGVFVSMRGDGVVVARERDGQWGFFVVEHANNAPRYLSYDLDQDRLGGYLEKYGESSSWRPFSSANRWIPAGPCPFEGHPKDWFFEAQYYDLVMVLSDGVNTFQRVVRTGTSKTLEDVPVEDVIEHLLQIRGTRGSFLQRRCHKFLTKHCVENEWQHADDFSVAAICMEAPDAP